MSLYEQLSAALQAVPEADLLDTINRAEHAITVACRTVEADAMFVPVGISGHPVDPILGLLAGRPIGKVAAVWSQLRSELADEVARRGGEPDVVHELREGGPRP